MSMSENKIKPWMQVRKNIRLSSQLTDFQEQKGLTTVVKFLKCMLDSILTAFNVPRLCFRQWCMLQFADEELATKRLTWLPGELSRNIRCIISTVTGTSQHVRFKQQTPKSNACELQPLTLHDKKVGLNRSFFHYYFYVTDQSFLYHLYQQMCLRIRSLNFQKPFV